jgi:hypothetical protein
MKMLRLAAAGALGALLATGCLESPPKAAAPEVAAQTYYTQFTLQSENGVHRTTNYRIGTVLPINTPVKVVAMGGNTIRVVIQPSGPELSIVNVIEYSGEDLQGIFDRTLKPTPVDLSRYTPEQLHTIQAGDRYKVLGMDRQGVIHALGYPPKHHTPSLNLNTWKYWYNRVNTFAVEFVNDHVDRLRS